MPLGTGTGAAIRSPQPSAQTEPNKTCSGPWLASLLSLWRHSRVGVRAERGDGLLEHGGHVRGGPLPPHYREWAHSRDDQK